MDIYYFESSKTGYICKSWRQYGPKEIVCNTYHMVNRKPSLQEAEGIYNLLKSNHNLATTYDFEPVLLSPAPTGAAGNEAIDWNAEAVKLEKQSQDAYRFVYESILNVSDVPVEFREIELETPVRGFTHLCLRWWPSEETGELRVYLKCNYNKPEESLWSRDTKQILEVAGQVQKAIAERGAKP